MKIVPIQSFSGLHFPTFGLNTRDTPYLSVFSLNTRKYGPKNSEYGHFSRSFIFKKKGQSYNFSLLNLKLCLNLWCHKQVEWLFFNVINRYLYISLSLFRDRCAWVCYFVFLIWDHLLQKPMAAVFLLFNITETSISGNFGHYLPIRISQKTRLCQFRVFKFLHKNLEHQSWEIAWTVRPKFIGPSWKTGIQQSIYIFDVS